MSALHQIAQSTFVHPSAHLCSEAPGTSLASTLAPAAITRARLPWHAVTRCSACTATAGTAPTPKPTAPEPRASSSPAAKTLPTFAAPARAATPNPQAAAAIPLPDAATASTQ